MMCGVPAEARVLLGLLVPRGRLVLLARLVLREQQERLVLPGRQAQQDQQVQQALLVPTRQFPAPQGQQDRPEPQGPRVRQAPPGLREQPDLQGRPEQQEPLVLQGLRGRRELPGLRVLLAQPALLVPQARRDPLGLLGRWASRW